MPSRGFSLVELLVVVAVCAILAGVGTPTFRTLRARTALDTATTQTLAGLHLARRLALARGQTITVCPSTDGSRCAFGGNTWLLFANTPAGLESRREEADELLRQWDTPAGVRVSGTRGYAAFQARPGAAATVTFEFCSAAAGVPRRRVIVSQTGRPRSERDADTVAAAACF